MADHYPKGLDDRMRDGDGEIRAKRSDTKISSVRKEYGQDVASGWRADAKLGTVLDAEGLRSLSQLIRKKK